MRVSLLSFLSLFIISLLPVRGQTFEIIETDAFCYQAASPLRISELARIDGNLSDQIEGVQITIKEGYEEGIDLLEYTELDGITSGFDEINGILTLSGTGTLTQYNDALGRVSFTSKADQTLAKTLNITLSGVDFLVTTGHFYQFFSAPRIRWDDARSEAESKELFGLQGYLTTITSTSENDFILNRVSGTAWIGASDEANEGVWRWVTGPEGLAQGGAGTLLSSGFTNWESGEPNNAGDEDYAHMMDWSSPAGKWNDLAIIGGGGQYEATGYIVEYGGLPGDPNVLENISADIRIEPELVFTLSGAPSVCPNIEGVIYQVEAIADHSYNWTVSGALGFTGQGTNQITVNWGDTNPNASVQVDINSDIICTYQKIQNVRINEKLEPPLPQGSSFVCFTDIPTPQSYSTPFTVGSTYTWKPTNGVVVDGQGTNEVQILWDGTADGALYFTESTSTSTDICDGDSPTLLIDIRPEIEYSLNITNVSCYQGSDGRATIDVLTAGTNLLIEWKTGGLGLTNGNEVSQLPSGNYSVDITLDDCLINIPVIVTEPEELVGSTDIENVLCYGQSNGIATALVEGGTGAYRYEWSHDLNQSKATVNNLPAGNHSVDVYDENDCLLTLEFLITEPDSLQIPEIITSLVSCPGGSDGTLEALVTGGTMPYTYEWVGLDQTDRIAIGLTKGDYEVIVRDANGCTQRLTQSVSEAVPKVLLPNAFTPNGDSMNNTFGPTTPCDIEFKMEIYSRWGETVFTTTSSTNRWDGNFKGIPVPEGQYSYAASWSFEANDRIITGSKKGEVTIFR